jgi:hypothetical protein
MTVKTAGTLATTTLSGQQWPGASSGSPSISDADIATIDNAILNDGDYPQAWPGAFSRMGLLYIPRRGVLRVLDGDWVLYDPSGFPYLVPRISLPGTLTLTGTTNTTTILTVTASALTAGWRVGTVLTSAQSDIPTNPPTTIASISGNGLTITMSAAATGSNAAQTITAGNWSHS